MMIFYFQYFLLFDNSNVMTMVLKRASAQRFRWGESRVFRRTVGHLVLQMAIPRCRGEEGQSRWAHDVGYGDGISIDFYNLPIDFSEKTSHRFPIIFPNR